jgi:hypothetical protein
VSPCDSHVHVNWAKDVAPSLISCARPWASEWIPGLHIGAPLIQPCMITGTALVECSGAELLLCEGGSGVLDEASAGPDIRVVALIPIHTA